MRARMYEPHLQTDAQREDVRAHCQFDLHPWAREAMPAGQEGLDWGLGGARVGGDLAHGRRAGSISWSGLAVSWAGWLARLQRHGLTSMRRVAGNVLGSRSDDRPRIQSVAKRRSARPPPRLLTLCSLAAQSSGQTSCPTATR